MPNKRLLGLIGVVVCVFLVGCGTANDPGHDDHANKSPAPADGQSDQHPTEGPHGGHLIELGDEQYHAELLHDEAAHTVTIHLLDASGKKPVSADASEITLQLFEGGKFVDHPLEAAEGASQFSIVDEGLCDTLSHADEVRGRLHVTIDGTKFSGLIEHHAHEHEGHDDDHGPHEDGDHDHPE